MYNVGKRQHHHRRIWLAVISLPLLGWGFYVIYQSFYGAKTPAASIHNTAPITTQYTPATAPKNQINKPVISFMIPANWQPFVVTTTPVPTYSYRSPSEQGQLLSIYIDAVPVNLAVNRVVAVTAQGATLQHSEVSDNCTSFTRPSKSNPGSGVAAGKWEGSDFLCDIGNYQRDVVGITSSSGLNYVTVSGPKTGTHKLYVTYTNNTINPDFSVFYTFLETITIE